MRTLHHVYLRSGLQTLATLAADPLASLVDTAWLGHLGTIQLAGVRVLEVVVEEEAEEAGLRSPASLRLSRHQVIRNHQLHQIRELSSVITGVHEMSH